MTDPLKDLAAFDRANRVLACPGRYLDYQLARLTRRLERMRAAEALAELQARGVRLSVRGGRLYAGPPELVVNGTAQRIEEMKALFVELLQEAS